MAMVKLNKAAGGSLYCNTRNITTIDTINGKTTVICFDSKDRFSVEVSETPEEVAKAVLIAERNACGANG